MITLIVAKADPLRNGLQTLLAALSPNADVEVLDDPTQVALRMNKQRYDSVFLYPSLPFDDLLAAARVIKMKKPATTVIFIITEPNQARLALEAGANSVLLKGFSAAQLMHADSRLGTPRLAQELPGDERQSGLMDTGQP
jgi:DNA-binding NarL/FixJ family response regulator